MWRLISMFVLAALLAVGVGAAPAAADPLAAPSAVAYHVVRPGEWVTLIARLYGVSPRAIIDANNLRPPYTIYPGQVLAIPTPPSPDHIHIVRYGDTLMGIGRLYGVPWGDIAYANNLGFPFTIYVGQHLRVPGASGPGLPTPRFTINSPAAGVTVTSPVRVSGFGRATQHNELVVRVRDANGNVVGQAIAAVQANLGQPGPFTVDVPFTIPVGTQNGRIEVTDYTPRDGSIVYQASQPVRLRR
jgi:LysM repeat protein